MSFGTVSLMAFLFSTALMCIWSYLELSDSEESLHGSMIGLASAFFAVIAIYAGISALVKGIAARKSE